MVSQKTFVVFSLFFVLSASLLIPIIRSETCLSSACTRIEPLIRFPFRLQNIQSESCGYPGFNLSCNNNKNTVLKLPYSGSFTVQGINYGAQEIWINDPDECLPNRLLSFNLTGSPFVGLYFQDITLFNCSADNAASQKLNRIGCLSGSTYAVYATSYGRMIQELSRNCKTIKTVSVPTQVPFKEQVRSTDLGEDLRLTWPEPRCGRCESRGGRCGFGSDSRRKIVCTNTRRGLPRSALYAISVGAGVPTLLFTIGLVCFIGSRVKSFTRRGNPLAETISRIAPQPTVIAGLDEVTIETFPKVVLGESRRLPKSDYNTCPICLSEYKPKETLRSIPECQHSFHAECIDEWLRLNATCPVCRSSPELSPKSQGL